MIFLQFGPLWSHASSRALQKQKLGDEVGKADDDDRHVDDVLPWRHFVSTARHTAQVHNARKCEDERAAAERSGEPAKERTTSRNKITTSGTSMD